MSLTLPVRDHFHAFFGPESQAALICPFQITASIRASSSFSGEIGMARGMRSAITRNLAAHPHLIESLLDRALDRSG